MNEADLPSRAGYEPNVSRVGNRAAPDGRIAAKFAQFTRQEAAAKQQTGATAYGFVNGVGKLAQHPALRRVHVSTPSRPVALAAPPVISRDGARALGAIPALGEHSEAIRAEFLA
jgi:itaconate CoA-transferase